MTNKITKYWKIVWREIGWDYTDIPKIDISTVRSGWAIQLNDNDEVYAWIENGCLAVYNTSEYFDKDIPLDMIEKLKIKENLI